MFKYRPPNHDTTNPKTLVLAMLELAVSVADESNEDDVYTHMNNVVWSAQALDLPLSEGISEDMLSEPGSCMPMYRRCRGDSSLCIHSDIVDDEVIQEACEPGAHTLNPSQTLSTPVDMRYQCGRFHVTNRVKTVVAHHVDACMETRKEIYRRLRRDLPCSEAAN
jgi:hypothetical protein